ncbi:MAG: putative MerR-family transcriptional regulator [Deltaproteobacteria bacterium]|nr:putative MerR-family transcriptional regulator [Deltaproteobacteria bacterium]
MAYRVEELAAAAGVRVDTIRFYQTKGLLPLPRRVKRVAVYSREHLTLLRRIRHYQSQGLSLAVIKRLLGNGAASRADTLLAAVVQESGERSLTRTQLAALSGVPEALLASLEAAGLIDPAGGDGEARYGEADLQMMRAGLDILRQGFPLDELLRVSVEHARQIGRSADQAIGLFDRYIRKAGKSGVAADEVADVFRRLLPAVTTLVALHFQRTLLSRALQRLREHGDVEAYAAAAAVLQAGRLEVTWR